MTNMKPTDIVTGLRNTRRSFGDGTLNGRSRVATPARTGSARKIPTSRISPPNAILGSGETITLSGTTRDANDRLEWSAIASSEKSSGFSDLSFVTTDIPTSVRGYYDIRNLTLELSSASGATVTVYAVDSGGNTRVVGSYAGSSTWKHLDPHDFALDVLDGESIRIVVDQPVTGTFYGNFRLVEQSRVVAATPVFTPTCAHTFPTANSGSTTLNVDAEVGTTVLVTMGGTGSSFETPSFSVPDGTLRETHTATPGSGTRAKISLFTVPVTQDIVDNGVNVSWSTSNGFHNSGFLTILAMVVPGDYEASTMTSASTSQAAVSLADATYTFGWSAGDVTSEPAPPSIDPDREEICEAGQGAHTEHWWWPAGEGTDTVVSGSNQVVIAAQVRMST